MTTNSPATAAAARNRGTRRDGHDSLKRAARSSGHRGLGWTESRIRAMVPAMSGNASAGYEGQLRRHGLQVTAQRLAVLRAVAGRPHATADDAYRVVRSELGAVSRQAIYDALAAFTDRGLLRCIQPAGSPARYEARVGDNHHHMICRTCHRMVDVDCAVGTAPCLTAAETSGFEIDEAEVVYWGRCPECASAAEHHQGREPRASGRNA
jgi:Fur family transcriptional regulator, stress-responsive regulator